jgi:hypothetical protein
MREILSILPDTENLKKLSQSLAMLDAIMSPDWEFRYYSFNSKWDKNEMMASMRKGSGDEYFILFNQSGAIIKGFAHESPMSPYTIEPNKVWKGVFENIPKEFESFLSEPAFLIADTTFCVWRKNEDSKWQIGDIDYPEGKNPDGLDDLLFILDGNPLNYKEFAEEYYETEIEIGDIKKVYEHKPLTEELVKRLNQEISLDELRADIEEIGYPNSK